MKTLRFATLAVIAAASSMAQAATLDLTAFLPSFSTGTVTITPGFAVLIQNTLVGSLSADVSNIAASSVTNISSFDYSLTGTDFVASVNTDAGPISLMGPTALSTYNFAGGSYSGSLGFTVAGANGTFPVASTAILTISNVTIANPVSAVPEPETYAMLLAGLGLMGTIARRRKKPALPQAIAA